VAEVYIFFLILSQSLLMSAFSCKFSKFANLFDILNTLTALEYLDENAVIMRSFYALHARYNNYSVSTSQKNTRGMSLMKVNQSVVVYCKNHTKQKYTCRRNFKLLNIKAGSTHSHRSTVTT